MSRRIFFTCLAISLLFHIGVLIGVYTSHVHKTHTSHAIQVTILTPSKPVSKIAKKLKPIRAKQIVSQSKPIDQHIPNHAHYLSQFNQSVKQQMRATQSGAFRNLAGRAGMRAPVAKTMQRGTALHHGPGDLPKWQALIPSYNWEQAAVSSPNRGPASATDDYLKGVHAGSQTLLNTRAFIYYSYYERIKARLRQYWESDIRQKITHMLLSGRTIASDTDRITKMIIILDSHGKLIGVQVIGPSGIRDLDEAAVDAFREAAPFPHPPRGMVGKDGKIKIRWDFVLEADAGWPQQLGASS